MEKSTLKKDYLKKYLSNSNKEKKKKKRIVTSSSSIKKSKIVDDDVDFTKLRPLDESELDIYDLAEDAPQIAGIIDDRPDEVKVLSQYRETTKWKVVTREYEDVEVSAVNSNNADNLPTRMQRRSSTDSDVSVPRNGRRVDDSDESPPRRAVLPARTKREHAKKNKSSTQDSDGDLSPPRKSRKSNRSASPHRMEAGDSDMSPPRNPHREKSDSNRDISRRRRSIEKELSSYTNRRDKHEEIRHRRSRFTDDRFDKGGSSKYEQDKHGRSEKDHASKKTLDGKKAGLQNAAEMKKEADILRRRHADSLAQLSDDVSGRGATAIMRDKKTGKVRDFKEEARQKREKQEKQAELVEKYAVWGKGMKQIEDRQDRLKSDLHEMSKPVARYADDDDLEEMQRNEEKEGDPMLEYMRNKRRKDDKTGAVRKTYQGAYNPNRYNIKPGHRWDGVDRSNGYEKQWFDERSNRKALEEEAFKWSTEDM